MPLKKTANNNKHIIMIIICLISNRIECTLKGIRISPLNISSSSSSSFAFDIYAVFFSALREHHLAGGPLKLIKLAMILEQTALGLRYFSNARTKWHYIYIWTVAAVCCHGLGLGRWWTTACCVPSIHLCHHCLCGPFARNLRTEIAKILPSWAGVIRGMCAQQQSTATALYNDCFRIFNAHSDPCYASNILFFDFGAPTFFRECLSRTGTAPSTLAISGSIVLT